MSAFFECNSNNCELVCDFRTNGRAWQDFEGLVNFCCESGSETCGECVKYYSPACELYEADTTELTECENDFYKDFNKAVNDKEMSFFLMCVMCGILAVRGVIKVIKSTAR
jgi:hypothetical protein